MERYEIERLNSLPIESVASRLGLDISHHKATCPFHADKHPSLTFNTRRNRYRCFVCGASGGTIDLVMNILHKSFLSSCDWLANNNCILIETQKKFSNSQILDQKKKFDAGRYEKFFERPFLNEAACHFLFDERHLDPRVVRWCRLNSYKDWLQIPYYSAQGQLVGIQQRYLGSDPEQPRFRFRSGERVRIYNQQILTMLRPGESLYLCEGCSDCWSLLSAGHKAIAIPSATLLKPQDLEPLKELGLRLSLTFEMYPDQDEPGERLFLQLREQLPDLIRHQLPSGCKDYSEYFCRQKYSEVKSEE